MRLTTTCLALACLATLGCGGASEAEKWVQDGLAVADRMAGAIERNDEAEATRLIEESKTLGERLKGIKMTDDEKNSLKVKYEPEMKRVAERILAAGLKNPQMMKKLKSLGGTNKF